MANIPNTHTSLIAEHTAICMLGLSRALAPTQAHQSPLAGVPALLLSTNELLVTSLPLEVNPVIPVYPRIAEIESAFAQIATAATMRLFPFELPLLAEISINLLRRIVDICGAVENFVKGAGLSGTSDQAVLSRLVFYLKAVNDFLGLVKTILLEVRFSLLRFCTAYFYSSINVVFFSVFFLRRVYRDKES